MAPRSPPVRIFDPLLVRALCHAVGGCGGDPQSTRLGHWYTMRYSGPRGFERSEEHTSELQSHLNLVCRLLLEKKKKRKCRKKRKRRGQACDAHKLSA